MKRVYFFDSLCGLVYRCMFAGLDENGHAQWVNLTPGEEPKTLEDYLRDEELDGTRFFVLALEGETVESSLIAKVMGKVAQCPFTGLGADLKYIITHMQKLGIKWNKNPLNLTVRAFENSATSRRAGKYSFWIENNDSCGDILTDVDGFESIEELFKMLRVYFAALESLAGISCLTKKLTISNKLRGMARKTDLDMFDRIEEDKIMSLIES